jgi:hypothetical protein
VFSSQALVADPDVVIPGLKVETGFIPHGNVVAAGSVVLAIVNRGHNAGIGEGSVIQQFTLSPENAITTNQPIRFISTSANDGYQPFGIE